MLNPCSCRHHLYFSRPDDRSGTHAVAVFQLPFQNNGDNFHVIVRMSTKTHSCLNSIVIEHSQRSKMHPVGIVITRKTEGMPGVEPSVIRMSPASCTVYC